MERAWRNTTCLIPMMSGLDCYFFFSNMERAWCNSVAYKRRSSNYVFILSRCIHANTAQNRLFEIVIYCVTSEKCMNGSYDLSVKNAKKNLKENITSTDINRHAVAARGVTFNLNLPRRKKVTFVNRL